MSTLRVIAAFVLLLSSAHASTVYVLGDSGTESSAQFRVRDRMVTVANATAWPVAFIHTGDMVYSDGQASGQDPRFFTPYKPLFDHGVRYAPCLGNHDARNKSVWLDVHRQSVHPLSFLNGTQAYYSADILPDVHLTMLDSNNGSSSTQKTWAQADLCASTARWKLVAFHHTSYSNSSHGSSSTMRAWDSIFRTCGVDLVLMGHDHDYERTLPQAGIVYVTTGGGGASLYGNGSSSFTAYSESSYHFTRLIIGDTSLCIDMIRDDGLVRDHSCIVAGGGSTTSTTVPLGSTTTVPPGSTTTTTTISSTTTSTTTTLPPSGILVNGGFEQGQTGWTGWGDTQNAGEARVDMTGPCAGASALHMFDSSYRTRQVRQDIAATSGLFRLTVRSKNLGTNQGAFRWEWRTATSVVATETLVFGGGTWSCTSYSVNLTAPVNATVLRLLPTLGPLTDGAPHNDAEIWFDALSIGDPITTTSSTTTTTTTTTTSTTTTTTTTLPPPVSPCVGPRIVVTGTRTTTYRPSIAPDGQIDATAATFVAGPDNKYAVQVHDGPGGCWTGGLIQGEFARDLTWGEMHTQYNPTAFAIHTPGFLVERLRIDNAGDGIKSRAENFTIRGVHLTWVRDDCIENIDKHSGLIEDSLLEECYVGVSTRSSTAGDPDAIVTIRNTLLGLVSMPGPHDSESRNPGHGNYFKDSDDSPGLILEHNIFFADSQTDSEGGLGLPVGARVVRCNNNTLVYAGSEPLDLDHLGRDPVTSERCFTVATDRRVWEDAVAVWKAAHP